MPSPSALEVEATPDGARFLVHLSPRAGREAVGGLREGALRVHVTAPPVDGAANAALLALLARRLGVPRSAVAIVSGATSRHKVVEVAGIEPAAVHALVDGAAGGSSGRRRPR